MSTADRPISFLAELAVTEVEGSALVAFEGQDAAASLTVLEADAGQEWVETRLRLETWLLPSGLKKLAR